MAGAAPTAQYVAAVFFAMETVTTVGYGSVEPLTTAEMVVALFIMLVGVLFFGFLISALSDVLEVRRIASCTPFDMSM